MEVTGVMCYVLVMSPATKTILERVADWPEKDQEELAEVAREIEARRTGIYELSAEEEAAIREGLADLDQGRWVSEESMRSFWKRCGVL
jgi:predicted transcriptional regulator